MDFEIGDIIEMKKGHPCGGKAWKIVRIGADIRLVCTTCGAHVMLARTKVEKSLKKVLHKAGDKQE
ncbi:MAG TPA: DUF951 domain-containing protein [Clostridiales bacterium]|nr:DUF951 domain-containing protein [Clostridiales bacterium]